MYKRTWVSRRLYLRVYRRNERRRHARACVVGARGLIANSDGGGGGRRRTDTRDLSRSGGTDEKYRMSSRPHSPDRIVPSTRRMVSLYFVRQTRFALYEDAIPKAADNVRSGRRSSRPPRTPGTGNRREPVVFNALALVFSGP